jgi:hypothetical protein
LLAEFAAPSDLVAATRALRRAGYRDMEAYSPFPIAGLAEDLGFAERRVPLAFLIGGIAGAAIGYGMQAWVNIDFPLDIGGRAPIASQAFMLIVFELTVLFSVLAGIGAMLFFNRLPRLHHPIFDAPRFRLASDDRFFLALFAGVDFDADAARRALAAQHPVTITELRESAIA